MIGASAHGISLSLGESPVFSRGMKQTDDDCEGIADDHCGNDVGVHVI